MNEGNFLKCSSTGENTNKDQKTKTSKQKLLWPLSPCRYRGLLIWMNSEACFVLNSMSVSFWKMKPNVVCASVPSRRRRYFPFGVFPGTWEDNWFHLLAFSFIALKPQLKKSTQDTCAALCSTPFIQSNILITALRNVTEMSRLKNLAQNQTAVCFAEIFNKYGQQSLPLNSLLPTGSRIFQELFMFPLALLTIREFQPYWAPCTCSKTKGWLGG